MTDTWGMWPLLALLLLCLLMAGCVTNVIDDPDAYTRADVDAINAETQCRNLARNLVQAQRCGVRR
jgi:hypothetical protein